MRLKIFSNYSPNFDPIKRHKTQIKFLIFHYTGMKREFDAINKLTKFQSEILANPYLTAYGSEKAFSITYPKLRQISNSELKDIKFYDFSGILHDDDLFENEIWFDFCHINHEGNEYVAKVINEKIFISE